MKCLEFYVLIMADSANGRQTEQNKKQKNLREHTGRYRCPFMFVVVSGVGVLGLAISVIAKG